MKYFHQSDKHQDNNKTETVLSNLIINARYKIQNCKSNRSTAINEITSSLPTDATLQCFPFNVRNFLACKKMFAIIPDII